MIFTHLSALIPADTQFLACTDLHLEFVVKVLFIGLYCDTYMLSQN